MRLAMVSEATRRQVNRLFYALAIVVPTCRWVAEHTPGFGMWSITFVASWFVSVELCDWVNRHE